MPRLPLLGRFRRKRGQSEPPEAVAPPPPPPVARRRPLSPGALRRERRAILRAREEMLRDLGGLTMEMYRREQFREDLLSEHARDVANLEARLHELDSMLAAAAAGRRATASRCACGAPVIWGSHFCPNCGRPAGEQAVVSCSSCGHPLPADADFCPSCGHAAELKTGSDQADEPAPRQVEAGDRDPDATVVGAATAAPEDEAQVRPDRWDE